MMWTVLLAAVAASGATPDAELAARAQALRATLVETRRDIHAYPELGNREFRTGKLVAERLRRLGLDVRFPVAKTGVVAVLRGGRPGRVVAVRADLDALPIEEKHDVPYRSLNPGVMHACGHDAHTAVVLGVAEILAGLKVRMPGTVVFLFQPAEEGPPEGEEGGAKRMIAEGALDDPKVEAIFGLHVDPLLDAGRVGWTAGPVFASSDRFVIEVIGKRTHGAYPHTGVDPVPTAAEIILGLQALVTRQSDAQRPKVLSIGMIKGGERSNIVAERVRMEGTLRALDEEERQQLKTSMARFVSGTAQASGAKGELRFVGEGLPTLVNDSALARRLAPVLARALGPQAVVEVAPQMGSEDFALYAQRVPALYLKLGVRNAARGITGMVHSEDFDLDEDSLVVGAQALSVATWTAASTSQ